MRRRLFRPLVWTCLGLAAIALVTCFAFLIAVYRIDRQRVRDADPAFRPLLSLGCLIWSNPVPFGRYCAYIVEFPPECSLSDANVEALESLNRLPVDNFLELHIRTPEITDRSLVHLQRLTTLDILVVTDSSISEEGIETLRRTFPDVIIPRREEPLTGG